MQKHSLFRLGLRGSVMAIAIGFLTLSAAGQEKKGEAQEKKEEATPRVWIYKDVPGKGETDKRSEAERYFTPYFFYPESKVKKIQVNAKKAASDLDGGAEGTCLEFTFSDLNANEYAGAGFIPGDSLGEREAYNIAEKLLVGFDRPVFLKFRARTKAKDKVKVRFECFGLGDGRLRDGIKTQTPDPDLTVLGDSWKDITVDITKKAAGLDSVVSPLRVVVRANENAGKEEIIVYVDDVRFEVGRPAK